MKKILALGLAIIGIFISAYAYTSTDIQNANYLATKGIVRDSSSNPGNYHLDDYVARAEVIGMILSMNSVTRNAGCRGDFPDIDVSTTYGNWVCRTIETAADHNYIYAQRDKLQQNRRVRPYDNISRSEALGILMKAYRDSGAWAGYAYYWEDNFPVDG